MSKGQCCAGPIRKGLLLPTPVAVVEVRKLVPLVVLDQAKKGSFEVRSHLDDKRMRAICREARSDEGHVERPTEGRYGVYGLLVVKSKDGIDTS